MGRGGGGEGGTYELDYDGYGNSKGEEGGGDGRWLMRGEERFLEGGGEKEEGIVGGSWVNAELLG